MGARVVAIVGSYRRGGATDSAVEAILEGARAMGAETRTFRLNEQHLEFCKNCRACTQLPGAERGRCAQEDDLESMLNAIEAADALVLASPVNYYNVTALFRRFLERLLGYTYWPWGQNGPKLAQQTAPAKSGVGRHSRDARISDSADDRRGTGVAAGGTHVGRKTGGQAVDRTHGGRIAARALSAHTGAGSPDGDETGVACEHLRGDADSAQSSQGRR